MPSADPAAALALLHVARGQVGDGLTACEIMPRYAVEATVRTMPDVRDPLVAPHPMAAIAHANTAVLISSLIWNLRVEVLATSVPRCFAGAWEDAHRWAAVERA